MFPSEVPNVFLQSAWAVPLTGYLLCGGDGGGGVEDTPY